MSSRQSFGSRRSGFAGRYWPRSSRNQRTYREKSTMRFMMLYKPGNDSETPPTQEHMEEMGRFIGEMAREGVLLATDGLQSSSKGAKVRISNGKFTVIDGPFTETKELI